MCPTDVQLQQLLNGTLAEGDTPTLETHIQSCQPCQQSLDRLTRFADSAWLPTHEPTLAKNAPLPVLPGYELLEELGRGGYGVVFRARDLRLNRIVAIKILKQGLLADTAERSRFLTEAHAAARLAHPHIVAIFEVNEADGLPFIAMEHLAGGTLAKRLDGTPLPDREAARVVEALARTVEYAHSQGVVHRDLKPGNVLMTAEVPAIPDQLHGTIKLADFGTARLIDTASELTPTQAILGTPSYMAPEQAFGQSSNVGPAADIYSLGAILYELLTGRPPFKAATPFETLVLVRDEECVPVRRLQPRVPRDLETICAKCLDKTPERRYGSAGKLSEDLKRFLEGRPILARPVGTFGKTVRLARRHPLVAGMSLALTSLALISIVTITLLWRSAAERGAQINQQKLQIEDRERLARTALDRTVGLIGSRRGKQVPTSPEEEEAIEATLEVYSRLLDDSNESLDFKQNALEGIEQLAAFYWYNGDVPRADVLRAQTVEHLERLLSEHPQNMRLKEFLARQLKNLSSESPLIVSRGRERIYVRCVELLREVHASEPDRRSTAHELAYCLLTLHGFASTRNEYDLAIRQCEEAREICLKLTERRPGDYYARLLIASSRKAIGDLQTRQTGNWQFSLDGNMGRVEFIRWRSENWPGTMDGAESQSTAFVDAARAAWLLGQREKAIALLREGRMEITKILENLPEFFAIGPVLFRNLYELHCAIRAEGLTPPADLDAEIERLVESLLGDNRFKLFMTQDMLVDLSLLTSSKESVTAKLLGLLDVEGSLLKNNVPQLFVFARKGQSKQIEHLIAAGSYQHPDQCNLAEWVLLSSLIRQGREKEARVLFERIRQTKATYELLPLQHDMLRYELTKKMTG